LGDGRPQKPKVSGEWKLALGLILFFFAVNGLLASNRDIPPVLQYSNDTQRISGEVTQFLILLLGLWLIASWFRTRWKNREQMRKQTEIEAASPPQSDQD